MFTFLGLSIVENPDLIVPDGEDWSRVRSPGRAARRRKRGFRQNIVQRWKPDPRVIEIGGFYVMHPAIADQLRRESVANSGPFAATGRKPDRASGIVARPARSKPAGDSARAEG